MGSEKQRGGGLGQQAVGQTQHPSRNCGISAKGCRGRKKLCDFFCGTHLCEGHKAKNKYFFRFFAQNNTLDWELIISANN